MTRKTRSFRPSPAVVISCLALFLALTGSAFAVGVAKNSVRSAQIADGTVRTIDLRDNSVSSPKIAPDAIGNEELAENSVDSPQVVQDSLTAADLGAASVGTSEVADQALTSADLGATSVGSSELAESSVRSSELGPIIQVSNETTIKGNSNASVDVSCPAGTTVLSGGVKGGFYQVANSGSYRAGNGWHVDSRSSANNDTNLAVYAYCLAGGSSN